MTKTYSPPLYSTPEGGIGGTEARFNPNSVITDRSYVPLKQSRDDGFQKRAQAYPLTNLPSLPSHLPKIGGSTLFYMLHILFLVEDRGVGLFAVAVLQHGGLGVSLWLKAIQHPSMLSQGSRRMCSKKIPHEVPLILNDCILAPFSFSFFPLPYLFAFPILSNAPAPRPKGSSAANPSSKGHSHPKALIPNTIAHLSQGTDDQRSNYARGRVIKALISNEISGHDAPPARRTFNSGSDHTQHSDALGWLSRYGTASTCAPQIEHPNSITHNYEGTSVEANLILHWFCEALNSGQPCYLSLYVGTRCPSWTFPIREF
jgi:hypothetical protein